MNIISLERKRLKIPGFDFKNTLNNIYEIESELSEKIIKSISQVNHNKVNRSSIKNGTMVGEGKIIAILEKINLLNLILFLTILVNILFQGY